MKLEKGDTIAYNHIYNRVSGSNETFRGCFISINTGYTELVIRALSKDKKKYIYIHCSTYNMLENIKCARLLLTEKIPKNEV